ncbi:MAG: hypothetical protein A3J76_03020 [Candidatus Moranbacteria bacterium RBG_13_45_13]|nr:MAG: hypothetical protein A3J76_03020 [Candidatus Moranbacteria bacterium RBG_13_45_13]
MNKKDIIKKIQKFLQNHTAFKKECEVVYLLAEIRKIIEKNNKYKTLYFYCCWILHSRLNRDLTAKILSKKFDKYINLNKKEREIQKDLISEQKDFLKLRDLNYELNNFLKEYTLAKDFLRGNKWYKFCQLFLDNIMECEIDFGLKANACKINRLSVEKINQNYYYQFYLSNNKRIPRIILKYKQK